MNAYKKKDKYSLSTGQKELWYIDTLGDCAKSAYNEHLTYEFQGPVSVNALKKAFECIIKKHELLRVSFEMDKEGELFQLVHPPLSPEFIHLNCKNGEQDQLIKQEIQKPFDLRFPPLLRVLYCELPGAKSLLVIIIHHIVVDGCSFSILINDLQNIYNQLVIGGDIVLSANALTWFDYLRMEQEKMVSDDYQLRVRETAQRLKGYSGLNFLTTPIMQNKQDIFSGQRVAFRIEQDLYQQMVLFCRTKRVTLFHLLYSVYNVLLYKYTRSLDIVIGTPFANREQDPDTCVFGYFANTLPLRTVLLPEESFSNFVLRVKGEVFTALFNQDIAFEHVAAELKCERKSPGQHPLIQNFFIWGNTDKLQLVLNGLTGKLKHHYSSDTSKFDLTLIMLEENKEQITAFFEYRDNIFDQSMIERFAAGFKQILKQVLENPDETIHRLNLLDKLEMQRMKEKFFNAFLDRKVTRCLGDYFSETAAIYKDKTGLIFNDKTYDYKLIEEKSNQWAACIHFHYKKKYHRELKPNTLIAICVDRSDDMIFGIIGILKAGAAYVPVDPQYPKERINYIIHHSKASLLLTHKKYDELLSFEQDCKVYMDCIEIATADYFIYKPVMPIARPEDLAYVLYTSGSTGQPKGVGVTHENIICLFESLKEQFTLTHQDVWSLFHTFCFDISVWEIWGAFLFGGTLVVIPYELSRDPKRFYQLIKKEAVTVLTQTPSAFQMFINEDLQSLEKLDQLRYVAFVGESLKVSILRPWVEKYGTMQPRLANMYGITETTVYTNYKFIDQTDINKGRDNIGWPLKDFSICIMDENLHWCPVGIVGEICIGGRGLSPGYLYREDLTKERFIQDPFASFLGLAETTRLYRTGDLGRWLEDGSIEYLGRKDFQVKLRGFRIELGEIEACLGSYQGISHTAVLLKGREESAYLAAFYTVEPGFQIDSPQLVSHLKTCLPEYMIPKTCTLLQSFPMTVNGKVDRACLATYEDNLYVKKAIAPLKGEFALKLAQIWAEVLKIQTESVGLDDNFFEAGGNSLLLVKLLILVSNRLSLDYISPASFIGLPTFSTLLKIAEFKTDTSISKQLWSRIKNDSILNPAIRPLQQANPCLYQPQVILLTGATGFLGCHLLYELLIHTEAQIYCLVRGKNPLACMEKIEKSLQKYKLDHEKYRSRILPVVGDLANEKLGLSDASFKEMCIKVDTVFHVGAYVHHVLDYANLFKINVDSTKEIINLAVSGKNKSIHFISTMGTQYISSEDALSETAHSDLNCNGYLTTKWVSEQLLQEASQRGIAAHIYRPGNIIAGTRGIYEPEMNHTLLRLKGMLQLGKGYVLPDEELEMMPVDLLAAELLKLSRAPQSTSYNLHHSESISWVNYLMIAKKMGYAFQFISEAEEWNRLLDNLNENNALYKLSHFYKIHGSSQPKHSEVKPSHLIATDPYKKMIEAQFRSLIQSGFLFAPEKLDCSLAEVR